ncbi:hypothetical protein CLV24_13429 [Pontibacter ummariensis]|uniref:DUF4149 domain-containing protein n=1 Tax=Pontibacter ummariensis TaxID=1610492 RepID=A0A239L2P3_9BACT|nr:hypothetical protein [Pontibacter ummariensis]PRY04623.1 hypothetical protein CLV24_13429 [Pontibacter ummariensis]SNT23969.1 hypothetical protein SAMN06296052_13414 [Pontibacter ummariensis]
MRKLLCLLPLLLLTWPASAQDEQINLFNAQQAYMLRSGMLVLGGWAIVNIMVGSFKLTKATRSSKRFFQMNLYWNIVNLLIAIGGLYAVSSGNAPGISLAQALQQHVLYKKILYLNVGLDVSYMVLGAYLQERSRTSYKTEQLQGWGQAIVLQGLFLFLLDLVLVVLLESIAAQLYGLIP